MGLFSWVSNLTKKAIDKVKSIGKSVLKGGEDVGKAIGRSASWVYNEAKSTVSAVVNKGEEIITAPAKFLEGMFKSPMTWILAGGAVIGGVVILPKVIK